MNTEPYCVLHIGASLSKEKIIIFNENTLGTCAQKKAIRDADKKKKSKFDNLTLPQSPNGIAGYHPSCLKYFCAIKPKQNVHNNDEVQLLDSDSEVNENLAVVENPKNCVFCNKLVRRRKGLSQRTAKATSVPKTNRICEILRIINPEWERDESNINIFYHLSCLNELEAKHLKIDTNMKNGANCGTGEKNNVHMNINSLAFCSIEQHVKDVILIGREVRALEDIFSFYKALFDEEKLKHNPETLQTAFKRHHLLRKLFKSFPNLTKTIYKKETFLHGEDLTAEEVFAKGFEKENNLKSQIKSVAFKIRKTVMGMEKKVMPKNNISPSDIVEGECDIAEELYLLIQALVNGPKKFFSTKKETRIKSICNSLIYTMSDGLIKPSMSMTLALTTKNITGSRKMIEILNRMGHCISYTATEELETELAYGCSKQKKILPYGLKSGSNLQTHVAFDNFDRFVETSSGKDTLHDTVGIVYQNMNADTSSTPSLSSNSVEENNNNTLLTKRRKYYSPFDASVEPYLKENRPVMKLIGKTPTVPENMKSAIISNRIWMFNHAFNVIGAKRWFAWNAERIVDENPVQKIGYLPNIDMSPTSDAVVRKTLNMSLELAKECNQNYIIVTYDLAIAAKAYKIQADMSPEFNDIFINLGAFHTQLSYFKAIGKFIDSSGIPNMIVESGLIAEGSIPGFLSGSHFSRCKKVHSVVALAFQIFHFEAFLEVYGKKVHNEKLYINQVIKLLEEDNLAPEKSSLTEFLLEDILEHYNSYEQETLNGDHGVTAKYVLLYIHFIELYKLFERAIRTSDPEMYIYAARNMCALFFTFNHQNYARWLTLNLDQLTNVDETHPGISESLRNGALSIRRTTKNFCRSAIDLTLEQTVNANAGNKLTGITAFRNSVCARQRWSETHIARTTITTHLVEFLGLVKLSETADKPYHSQVFRKKIEQFKKVVSKSINPFSDNLNRSKLFNLSSGKAASEETAMFLLQAEALGLKQMENFIKECQNDNMRFDRPIKRNKICSFATEIFRRKKCSHKNSIDEAKIERNILGQVFCLALKKEIDLLSVLSYPLTTFPHSLAHVDGSMISNQEKGNLVPLLISKIPLNDDPEPFMNFDVEIIDGFEFLKGFRDTPAKYGMLASYVLKRICETTAREIHIIFDKPESPSYRDLDIGLSKDLYESTSFHITGPSQERSMSLLKCLLSYSFREELIKFIISYWSKDEISTELLNDKRLFLSFGDKCYLFGNEFDKGKILARFQNNHIEVESKIILHAYNIRMNNILIRSSNADKMLVYSLYHMQFWTNDRQIWIKTSNMNKHTVQLLNVRKIYGSLSPTLINALPAWFNFTGSAYEPSFFGKGRKTCLKVLEKNIDFQIAFGNIDRDESVVALEEYTSQLYNVESKNVNRARVEIFEKAYSAFGVDFSKKGIDFKNMPPCRNVFINKVKRTACIARMIKSSNQNEIQFSNDGWLINENNEMEILFFDGKQYPEKISQITIDNEENESEEDSDMSPALSDDDTDITESEDEE